MVLFTETPFSKMKTGVPFTNVWLTLYPGAGAPNPGTSSQVPPWAGSPARTSNVRVTIPYGATCGWAAAVGPYPTTVNVNSVFTGTPGPATLHTFNRLGLERLVKMISV